MTATFSGSYTACRRFRISGLFLAVFFFSGEKHSFLIDGPRNIHGCKGTQAVCVDTESFSLA